jgi:hypothetical protein
MRIIVLILTLAVLFVGEVNAQRSKKKTKRVESKTTVRNPVAEPKIRYEYLPTSTEFILVDTVRYMVVGTGQDKRIIEKPIADRGPEPLLRIDYLVEYPKIAIERQLEDTIRFFATVKKGLVTNVVLQGDAEPLLMDAVREAASKLKFDLSWHDANRPEFQYTQQIIFKLPDIILSRP